VHSHCIRKSATSVGTGHLSVGTGYLVTGHWSPSDRTLGLSLVAPGGRCRHGINYVYLFIHSFIYEVINLYILYISWPFRMSLRQVDELEFWTNFKSRPCLSDLCHPP
jgi:hypothetical protein